MYCVKKIKDDLFWVGGTDRVLLYLKMRTLFPEEFPTMHTF